jgi:magnesium transporter
VRVLTEIDPDALRRLRAQREFFWLDLTAPSPEELQRLRHELGLAPPPAHEPGTRRRLLVDYDTYVCLIFHGADIVDETIRPFEVVVYISGEFVVTHHDIEVEELDRLRRRLERRGAQDEQLAVARVLDAIADSFVTALSGIDERINLLEQEVIVRPRGEQLERIARLQRDLLSLRRTINPQRDVLVRSADDIADLPGLEPADKDYLHEVADYLNRISEQVDHYAELVATATDIYLSRVSNQLNDVMKRLTIVATIFLPLTFVTGFFGQNFGWMVDHIASLTTFVVWGIGGLVVAGAGMLVLFRRGDYL